MAMGLAGAHSHPSINSFNIGPGRSFLRPGVPGRQSPRPIIIHQARGRDGRLATRTSVGDLAL